MGSSEASMGFSEGSDISEPEDSVGSYFDVLFVSSRMTSSRSWPRNLDVRVRHIVSHSAVGGEKDGD